MVIKFKKEQNCECADAELCVGGLQKSAKYEIESVSPAGYIWLQAPETPAGRIGPYLSTRFV